MKPKLTFVIRAMLLSLCLICSLSCTLPAFALTSFWTNASGGNWSETANWSDGVPAAGDSAVIDLAGTYTVTVDQNVEVETVVLGDSGFAHATLELPNWTFTTGGVGVLPMVVDSNCVFNIGGPVFPVRGPFDFFSYPIWNYGQIVIGDYGYIDGTSNSDGIETRETGTLTIENGGSIQNTTIIVNYGYFFVYGSGNYVDCMIQNSGFAAIFGSITSRDIQNYGTFNIAGGGSVYIEMDGFNPGSFTNHSSVVFTGGNSFIDGDFLFDPYFTSFYNSGTIEVVVDTSQVNDVATIGLAMEPGPGGFIHFSLGNLSLTHEYSELDDSIYVAPGCTLRVEGVDFSSTAAISGLGTVHFAAETMNVGGRWHFGGGFLLFRDIDASEPIVLFEPEVVPSVSLNSLAIIGEGQFVPPAFDIDIDTVAQYGGVLGGNVVPNTAYGWAGGTIVYDNNNVQALTIPPGVDFTVFGASEKTLDSIDLRVEGTASFTGTGVLSLVDSARVYFDTDALADFVGRFTLVGVGDVYNAGDADFDPQLDTILIDVPIHNSTVARSPGTIDILSRRVIFGSGGSNTGVVTVESNGELILDGEYQNYGGVIRVIPGGVLEVPGSLINGDGGVIELPGGTEILGDGDVQNGGDVNAGGTFLLTPTNVSFAPQLINLDDSGFVNVLQDTLTLLGGGINRGVITIASGAVLKVYGTFVNDTTGIIQGGGVLNVVDAVFTNHGTISAGSSPGILTIQGNVDLRPTSQLTMELNGASLGTGYDQINVSGTLNLGGTLQLLVHPSYLPAPTDTLRLLNYGAATRQFATITGTQLSNGTFLELSFGPSGMTNFVCNGVSSSATSIQHAPDSMLQTENPLDTLVVNLCNAGHCPLTFSASIVSPFPASGWTQQFLSGDQSGHLLRSECKPIRIAVDVSSGADAGYGLTLQIASNDPVNPLISIPLTWTVWHGPDVWYIGAGQDFDNFTAASNYLNAATILWPQRFYVYPEVYNETVTFTAVDGGSATNHVLFTPQNPAAAHPRLTSSGSYTLALRGAKYFTFDGIDISTSGGARTAVLDTLDADYNTFRNLTISTPDSLNPSGAGIVIASTIFAEELNSSIVMDNLTVYGFLTGVSIGRSAPGGTYAGANHVLQNSTIFNCQTGVYVIRHGNVHIQNNLIRIGYPASLSTVRGVHVAQLNSMDTAFVHHNLFTDARGHAAVQGVFVNTNPNGYTKIYNNMFTDFAETQNNNSAIQIEDNAVVGIFYNSIAIGDNLSGSQNKHRAIYARGGSDVTVMNNAVQYQSTVDSTWGIVKESGSVDMVSNRNCLQRSGSRALFGQWNGFNADNLSQWQLGTSQDMQSEQDNPGFISLTDLHIDGYWDTCDSNATPVAGITTDFDGEPRNANYPDIGADEMTGLYQPADSLVVRRVGGSNNVKLDWTPVAGAVSYKIYADSTANLSLTTAVLLGTSATNSYVHVGAIASPASSVKYYYLVRPSTQP